MEILLKKDIDSLGSKDEIVSVKNGFGRNFLLKQGKALRFNKENQELVNKKKDELYRRMHVLENGKIISGAESFLIIWKQIPKYNFLCKFFKSPLVFPFFNIIYEVIAYFLYLKSKLSR